MQSNMLMMGCHKIPAPAVIFIKKLQEKEVCKKTENPLEICKFIGFLIKIFMLFGLLTHTHNP